MTTACWLLCIAAAAVEFEASGIDGTVVRGELRTFTADKVMLREPSGDRELPLSQVVRLHRPGVLPVAKVPLGAWIDLTDGSRVLGQAYSTAGGRATIVQDAQRTLSVPTDLIRSVRLKPLSPELTAQWDQIAGSPVKADCVVIREGDSLDYLEGVLGDFGAESFAFQLDGEALTVKRTKAEGLVYFHARRETPAPTFCLITDVLGSKVLASSVALTTQADGAGALQFQTAGGTSFSWPLDRVVAVEFPVQYLSGFKPESFVFTPRFPSAATIAATVAQFYRPRFDRASDSGPLRLGGRDYARGLSMRSRSELTFLLPEPFVKFTATAGIDDRYRPDGQVRLVIRGDDRVLFDQVITGQDDPTSISLDLTGVVRLKILVDYHDESGVGDHLDLCDPRLFK